MLVPEDPALSEDELFKEDDGEDPDYVPPQHDPNTPGPSNEAPTKRRHTDDEKNEEEKSRKNNINRRTRKGKELPRSARVTFKHDTNWTKRRMNNLTIPK